MVEVNPERKNGQKMLDELNRKIEALERNADVMKHRGLEYEQVIEEIRKLLKERGKLKAKLMLLGQYER